MPKTVVNDDIQQPADGAVEKVIVPDLGQMNAMEAIDTFINMGLDPIVETQGEDMYAYLPPAGTVVDKGSSVLLYCKNPNETAGTVPDLTGKSIRECDRILSGLGYRLSAEGSGVARRQQPEAGTVMEAGGTVYVTFATTGQELEEPELEEETEQTVKDLSLIHISQRMTKWQTLLGNHLFYFRGRKNKIEESRSIVQPLLYAFGQCIGT